MRILITNDDGIHAPGLEVLEKIARALSDDVWVVAPESDQSGVSHSLSLNDPLRLREIGSRRFAVKGTPTDCVIMGARYIVKEGSFRVTREHSDGRAITLATLGPGEIFGELAMLDGDQRSASAEALTEGELLALPANDVRALLARHPEISLKLVAGLVRRLRAANVRLSRQSFQTVPSRVAGILAQLSREAQDDGDGDGAPSQEVTIQMNQTDLAQLAGTSRESVSRFLAELERAGVVRSGRGRVTVLEPAKLRNYIY